MTAPLPKPDKPGLYRVRWSNGEHETVEVEKRDSGHFWRNNGLPGAEWHPVGDGRLAKWWPFENPYDED